MRHTIAHGRTTSLSAGKYFVAKHAMAIITMLVAVSLFNDRGAVAAEGATSFYLLGLRGPGSAITPPPDIFLQNDFF
jgi:hypothetical protein